MRISDWSSDVCSSDLHVVVRTEEQRYLDIDHRVSGHHARRQGFLNALVDGRDVLARNHTALDGVDEFVAATWLARPELARKSVVLGKRGSVRVDLVGRSVLKKNTKIV